MKIIRADERPTTEGDRKHFTGKVTMQRVIEMGDGGNVSVSVVHFHDGARTNWHVHPGEQILYILEGEGRVGTESEQHLVYPGDIIREEPGVTHWHGAVPGKDMTHISITTVGSPRWLHPPED